MHRIRPAAALSLLLLSGCAVSAPQPVTFAPSVRPTGPHDPSILMGYSHLTKDGLRIAAKLDPGTYPFTDVTITYAVAGPGDPAPITEGADGKASLAATNNDKGRFNSKEEEVAFTIARGSLGKLGDRVIWYRWTIRFDKGGSEPKVLQSGVFRTSRAEAGLPRAPESPGPDTAVQPGPGTLNRAAR